MSCHFIMKNIVCKNAWRKVGCCDGATDLFEHGIFIIDGKKVFHKFQYPFEVSLHGDTIHFVKDKKLTVVLISELAQTKAEVKQIIQDCSSSGANGLERRSVRIEVTDSPVTEVDLNALLNAGESLAGIYDVFNPSHVDEGSLPTDYTVLENGNIEFNTEIPVDLITPYIITINYWVHP